MNKSTTIMNEHGSTSSRNAARNTGRLLVDYSKTTASTTTTNSSVDRTAYASRQPQQQRQQRQLVVQAPATTNPERESPFKNNIPGFVTLKSTKKSKSSPLATTGPTAATTTSTVSFQMRRARTVDRDSFLTILKLHRSASDIDTTPVKAEEDQMMVEDSSINHEDNLMTQSEQVLPHDRLSLSCHSLSFEEDDSQREKRFSRRVTLKKALRKTTSTRHLDTSPLSTKSMHDQLQFLPLKSVSCHGGTTIGSGKSMDDSDESKGARKQQQQRPQPRRRRAMPLRTRSYDDSTPSYQRTRAAVTKKTLVTAAAAVARQHYDGCLTTTSLHRLAAMENNTQRKRVSDGSSSSSSTNMNRRTMMQRQSSFVTGSRIRIL